MAESTIHWLICQPNPYFEPPDPKDPIYEGFSGIFAFMADYTEYYENDPCPWEYEIEHSPDCERAEIYRGSEHVMTEWRCWVESDIRNCGDDLAEMLREVKEPGRYPFVAWMQRYRDDADGGLRFYDMKNLQGAFLVDVS